MDYVSETMLSHFKPVCNKAQGQLDPSSPHARNAALMPFLFFMHPSASGHLHVLTSDFHFNTWHASFSYDVLNSMKESLGIQDNFPAYLHILHGGFSSNKVKVELGGPASAVGGVGASSAKLCASVDVIGESRDVFLELELSKGRLANDTMGTLAWELYELFAAARAEALELQSALRKEKERNVKLLDTVAQQKASSVHLFPNKSQLQSCQELDAPTPLARLTKLSRSLASMYGRGGSPRLEAGTFAGDLKPSEKSEEEVISAALKMTQIPEVTCNSAGLEIVDVCEEQKRNLGRSLEVTDRMDSDLTQKSKDLWARRHYMDWQRDQGLPEREIEDMPVPDFADSLVKFFRMVKKHNGSRFPSDSLKSMFRAFVRIIRSHYKSLYMQGKYDGPIVDASQDMRFEKARLACMEAMENSTLSGANKKRKVEDRQPSTAEEILCHPANQTTHAHGLARRLCFYAIHKFHICGYMELYNTTDLEFSRGVNERGDVFWEYDEKRAMKYKYREYKYKETTREALRCFEADVIECLDKYFMHLPSKAHDEPRRLFLAPISRPRSKVWFSHQNISSKTLRAWYRYMCSVFNKADIQNRGICLPHTRIYTLSLPSNGDTNSMFEVHREEDDETDEGAALHEVADIKMPIDSSATFRQENTSNMC